MIKVSTDQFIIDIVRLILQHSGQDIYFFDDDQKTEQRLNGDHLLNLFASGFSSECTLKTLTKTSQLLIADAEKSGQNEFDYSVDWFISIFDSLHDGILIADNNEVVRYINKSFERISGAKFADVVGRVLAEARPGARLGGVIRSGKPLFSMRRKFGDVEYMTDMHPLIVNGRCMGGVTIARDITEIQQLQTKLSKYRVRYNDLLRQVIKENTAIHNFADIFGQSASIEAVKQLAKKLAVSNLPILLRGESGTGKELFAHAIHQTSDRQDNAFVTVNCAAIPGPLLESELFGYHEGAFTGAKQGGKPGLITLAHEGTLFLDEIGDMDIEVQAKMLRVLQTGEVQPLGSIQKSKVDVRFIAATNRDIEKMIAEGKFREDLFYRLNVSQINIPPLRERQEDIAPLAKHFLANCIHHTLGRLELGEETLKIMEQYSWPGNVRELENTIRFIANITDRKVITPNYLPQVFFQNKADRNQLKSDKVDKVDPLSVLKDIKYNAERDLIIAALEKCGRSVKAKREAAKHLGISLTTLYTRMSYFDIK